MTTVVSNGHFWMFTIALLIIWIIVLTTAFNAESKIIKQVSLSQKHDEDELKNNGICKNLCKQCDCLGFYCGEECICECNDDHADTECIRQIQLNAQSLNIPFEVLIQGPTVNNFVRKALQYEQNRERKLIGYRSKRSTVTVYKPNKGNKDEQIRSFKEIFNVKNKLRNRRKRSSNNNQFDWFSDVKNNNLLQPAPLGGCRRKTEEPKMYTTAPKDMVKASMFDNSWIFDNTHNILTPRPLNKCKSPNVIQESNVDTSIETTNTPFNDKLNADFVDERKIDTINSEDKINDKNSFSSEQKDLEKSQGNLLGSLYSRLFGNDFSGIDDNYSFFPQVESQDYHTGDQHSARFKEDVSENLFSEEDKEEKMLKKSLEIQSKDFTSSLIHDDSSTSQVSSPANVRNGLHELRIPWLKPGKLLEKFRRVINS